MVKNAAVGKPKKVKAPGRPRKTPAGLWRRTPTPPGLRGTFGFTVVEAGAMIGLSPGSAYKAAHAGEIPVVKIGSLLIVPRRPWLTKLGIEDVDQEAPVNKPADAESPATAALPVRAASRQRGRPGCKEREFAET
jgi:hypothetical protein